MAEYKRPTPKPYPSNDNAEAQLVLYSRQTDPSSRVSKHDGFDDGNDIGTKLPRTDSGLSEKRFNMLRMFSGGRNIARKPTSDRRKHSKRGRHSTKRRVRRSRLGSMEDHGDDEETDGVPRAPRPPANDDEPEEEPSDSIDASSPDEDHGSALNPPEGYSSAFRVHMRDLERQVKEKDRQVSRLVRDLSHIQKADSHSRDDSHFIDLVQKLRELVKNWSRTQKHQRNHLSSATRELSIVGPSYKFFLAHSQNVAALIQAYLWIQLQNHVFKLHRWAGDLCDKFQDLEDILRPTLPVSRAQHVQFHEWRAITARLIDEKLTDENLPEYKSVNQSLVRQILGPLAPEDMMEDSRFSRIVKRALELASEIAKQKAELCFPKFNDSSVFNPDLMDDIKQDDSEDWSKFPRKVQLVTAPALVRSGDLNGDDHHVKTAVVKAEVICSI